MSLANMFDTLGSDKRWKALYDSTCWLNFILMCIACHDCICLLKISDVCPDSVGNVRGPTALQGSDTGSNY